MDLLLVSNISSWVLVIFIWMLVHQYSRAKSPWDKSVAISLSLLALSLLSTTLFRVLDETYLSVIVGGIGTKIIFSVVVCLMLIQSNAKETK